MVWTLLQLLSVTDFLTLLFPLLRAFRAQRPGRACVDKRVATIASAPWGKILRPLSPYRHMYKTNARSHRNCSMPGLLTWENKKKVNRKDKNLTVQFVHLYLK